MNRDEFLSALNEELGFLPLEEREAQMRYFRARIPETAEETAVMFGTPRETAERIFRQKQADTGAAEQERYDFKIIKEEHTEKKAGLGLGAKVAIAAAAVIFGFPAAAAASLTFLAVLVLVIAALLFIAGAAVLIFIGGLMLIFTCFMSQTFGAAVLQIGLGFVFAGAGTAAIYFGAYAAVKAAIAAVRVFTEFVSARIRKAGR